jgi:hypothetical protein
MPSCKYRKRSAAGGRTNALIEGHEAFFFFLQENGIFYFNLFCFICAYHSCFARTAVKYIHLFVAYLMTL